MKKRKQKKVQKTERIVYKTFVFTTIILIIGIVYSRAALSKINLEVQALNETIKDEKEDNQSLVMRINEMISLENIQEISNSLGLTYNNDNIVSVTE